MAGKDKHVEGGCIVQGFWLIGVELFFLPNGESYRGVYQANLFRLGALFAREAAQVVRFYQLADSVRADVLRADWVDSFVGILSPLQLPVDLFDQSQ